MEQEVQQGQRKLEQPRPEALPHNVKPFEYDRTEKTIRKRPPGDELDEVIRAADADMSFHCATPQSMTRVVLSDQAVARLAGAGPSRPVRFAEWDGGEVYVLLPDHQNPFSVPGTVHFCDNAFPPDPAVVGKDENRVRIVVQSDRNEGGQEDVTEARSAVKAFVKRAGAWQEASVQVVPIRAELFSRNKGLLETGVLSDKRVLLIGLGSVGGTVAVELCKAGVMHFGLIDHDILDVGNIVRHEAPLSHLGRYKSKSVKHLLLEKNPYCHVETWECEVSKGIEGFLREQIRTSDLVLCAADTRACRLLVNKYCVMENVPVILAGATRRAFGGRILVVHPHESPCYECFLASLRRDTPLLGTPLMEQADSVAYSDRPVPIEPGLSVDIMPINIMTAKLAIQELLKGRPTTLQSLDEDLVAPLYLWLNRREADSPYAELEPLAFNTDGMHVLGWYGLPLDRFPGCHACGDYVGHMESQMGFKVTEEDERSFALP